MEIEIDDQKLNQTIINTSREELDQAVKRNLKIHRDYGVYPIKNLIPKNENEFKSEKKNNDKKINFYRFQSNSVRQHEERVSVYKIKTPLDILKGKISRLEKQLFSLMNIKYGEEIIYDDFPIISDNQDYYVHLLRTAKLDYKKENFLLIHGFLSSSTHFLSVLPYLLLKYNVFIPDTIGMGLSSRPQVIFDSPEQCESYFIEIIYILVKKIFLSNRYKIKKNFYIGGHSLGGFMVSHYMIKYPIGIKKVLLLSSAGITDYRIRGTNMHKEAGLCFGCLLSFIACCWACKPRIQCCYKCICFKNLIKSFMESYSITIDQTYIKKNEDGSPFIVNIQKVNEILGKLSKLTLDFPDDIYKCIYYLFTLPPPASVNPVELKMLNNSKLSCIFVYGENDWMDRTGAFRLCQQDRERFKLYIVTNAGHSFAMENPKGLENILDIYF